MKAGYKTTEFWATVAANVGIVAASISGSLSPRWAAIASAVSLAAYSLSRGLAKSNTPAA